jgi:WXG100 family type VII secretion target
MDLVVNDEIMKVTQEKYEELATAMEELKRDLTEAMNNIRAGWDSGAGDAFFAKYDDEWLRAVSDYTDVLRHMADNIKMAKNKYQEVFDCADGVKLPE